MIKTIVVPTDGSTHAKKAIGLAADLSEKYGARMVILHVILRHISEYDLESLGKENEMPEALEKKFEKLRRSFHEKASYSDESGAVSIPIPEDVLNDVGNLILDKAQQIANAKGVRDIVTQILDGAPADKIIAIAEKENADMIIMGSRGLGNIRGLLMGSVSHKVSHLSKSTCVTVK